MRDGVDFFHQFGIQLVPAKSYGRQWFVLTDYGTNLGNRKTNLRQYILMPPKSPPLARYRPQGLQAKLQTVSSSIKGGIWISSSASISSLVGVRAVITEVGMVNDVAGRRGWSFWNGDQSESGSS